MRWEVWVHESLKAGSPPLCQAVPNFPLFIHSFTRKLRPNRSKAFIEALFKPWDLVVFRVQVVAWSV